MVVRSHIDNQQGDVVVRGTLSLLGFEALLDDALCNLGQSVVSLSECQHSFDDMVLSVTPE